MKWELEYLPEALDDLNDLDHSVKLQIVKGISRVLTNPEPKANGGYGEPLGSKHGVNLTGLYKIKFRGLGQRVVYALRREEDTMTVVIVSAREDCKVYNEAEKRRKKHNL